MFAIDELAYASPMRRWPPLGKFLLALALLIASLVSSSLVIPLIVLAIGTGLLFLSTRLRFPRAIALAILEGIAIFLLGAVIIALVTREGGVLFSLDLFSIDISLTQGGLERGLTVFLRALAGISVMLFFATSTPIPHFAAALRQLHVPSYITELVILVYRYSFLLFEQLDILYTAAHCRLGFRGARNKIRTTGKLAVSLFIKSLEVAERSQTALYCRNFKGDFPLFRPPIKMTLVWAVLPFLTFGLLYATNYALSDLLMLGW
ncbi:MAG: cobalt ECF transporter T component CbiQ [Methanomassiliicoccales archaeon]|nr:cobalt ECF transporter T component CbiQ [Methanomassiliicoccales archaeon]